MLYTITIKDLINREIIRTDLQEEWMNKMSDIELLKFKEESYKILIENGTPNKYPDINASYLSCVIDRTILYNLLKDRK